jgi:hypothetical protein
MATLVPGEKARMYALGAIMRGGASRGGYIDGRVYVSIGGADIGFIRDDPKVGTIIDSLSITQQLDEVPDTANLRINAAVPPAGGEVVIALGSQNGRRLFAGYGLTRNQLYAADKPANIQADFSAVDYTWLLAFAKVTKQYRNVSGTAIIADLIATYGAANGFTTNAVQANLPALEITFTDEDVPNAITRLMRRLGGHWFVDYAKDVHAWIGEDATMTPPMALTPTHPSLADVRATVDQTQALTRCYVEHRGSSLLAGVAVGETILPVEAIDAFVVAPDVFLKVTLPGADGGAKHLNFTGVVPSPGGSLVGPGAAPSGGPTLTLSGGGAIEVGAHGYAFTWQTAAGETRPSPATSINVAGAVATGTLLPVFVQQDSPPVDPNITGAWKPGDTVEWAYSYATRPNGDLWVDGTSTPLSPSVSAIAQLSVYHMSGSAPGSNAKSFEIAFPFSTNPAVRYIDVYYRVNGGGWRRWLSPVLTNDSTDYGYQAWKPSYTFYLPYNASAWTPPSVTPVVRTVTVSGIATGPANVTGRKVYRTAANQATLKLVTTLANNTATTYTDAAADATLGATAPVGDTSGLQSPTGTVNAGSTSVIVASVGPFAATGGWALAGEQALRYTGLGAGALTGIPATGRGAVVGPIQYNTAIRAAPLLTGVTVDEPIEAGAEIYAVVRVDDEAGQATLAARLGIATGIREEWIQDRRLSYGEAKARGQATLQVRPLDALSISYRCRDISTSVGKTITVNLPAPTNIVGTFRIQAVTITNFRPRPEQPPTFHVQASSTRFTFEDWLRIIKTQN